MNEVWQIRIGIERRTLLDDRDVLLGGNHLDWIDLAS
jgi:hypothetical protein